MDKVSITTVTTAKSPKRQKAVGMFLVEVLHEDVPKTISKTLVRESVTNKELTIQLLANSICIINRINTECEEILMHIDEQIICSAISNKWIEKWSNNNWKNAKGEEVANAELWKVLQEEIKKCKYPLRVSEERSQYDDWMHNECNRELKKEKENDNAKHEKG